MILEHSPRPPSRRVEQLRGQVRRGSRNDEPHPHNDEEGEGEDFTFEGFFTGNFDIIPQPRIAMMTATSSHSIGVTKANHITSPVSKLRMERLRQVDEEEANEFFPLPPSGANLGDLLLTSDEDESLACSHASTPPPQSLGDALQRSFKLYAAHPDALVEEDTTAGLGGDGNSEYSPIMSSSTAATLPPTPLFGGHGQTLANRRGFPSATHLVAPVDATTPHRNSTANEEVSFMEPYDHTSSHAVDIVELFASCHADLPPRETLSVPQPTSPSSSDHTRVEASTTGVPQQLTPENRRSQRSPSPVSAALLAILRNQEVFDWFDLDDDGDAAQLPEHNHPTPRDPIDWVHSIHSGQDLGLETTITRISSMMPLDSSVDYAGDSPQHSMSMRHTQGTTSPVVSITSTSFHGALARFQFPSIEEGGQDVFVEVGIKPVVRIRSVTSTQPRAVAAHRRCEVATQTNTPRLASLSAAVGSVSRSSVGLPRVLSPNAMHPKSRYDDATSSSSSSSDASDCEDSSICGRSTGIDRAGPARPLSPTQSQDSLHASNAPTPVPMEQFPHTGVMMDPLADALTL